MVTCDLIPLAVLKPGEFISYGLALYRVTCDLIPLAVLKRNDAGHTAFIVLDVTCDLIPLAVLKRALPRRQALRASCHM